MKDDPDISLIPRFFAYGFQILRKPLVGIYRGYFAAHLLIQSSFFTTENTEGLISFGSLCVFFSATYVISEVK
ncbi:MAG: hypothetical protein C5B59_19790 [Bacteroidetes bacterium]|nr:MAG: hypothetical protein C5B59_19790 [Bacteroidota bacterium]